MALDMKVSIEATREWGPRTPDRLLVEVPSDAQPKAACECERLVVVSQTGFVHQRVADGSRGRDRIQIPDGGR